jgi:hypothetical protein
MYLTEKQHLGSVGGPVFVKGKIELVFFLYMYIIKNKSNENLACQHLNLQALWRFECQQALASHLDARNISRSSILVLTRLFAAALCAFWTTTQMRTPHRKIMLFYSSSPPSSPSPPPSFVTFVSFWRRGSGFYNLVVIVQFRIRIVT